MPHHLSLLSQRTVKLLHYARVQGCLQGTTGIAAERQRLCVFRFRELPDCTPVVYVMWARAGALCSLLCTVSPLCSQRPGCEVESRCPFALCSPPPSSAPSSVLISRFHPGPGTATNSSSPMWVPVLTRSDAPLWGSVCKRRL